MANEIKKGQKYSNYKNPKRIYKIVDIAKHSETLEDLVVYKALYSEDYPKGQVWVRPRKMFLEIVEKEGYKGPRFKLIQ
ncbi:MAG: DUF1653 domain-containing protein [archaeon]